MNLSKTMNNKITAILDEVRPANDSTAYVSVGQLTLEQQKSYDVAEESSGIMVQVPARVAIDIDLKQGIQPKLAK